MIWPYSGLFGLYDFENGKRWCHMNFYFQIMLKSPKNYENLGFSTSGLCLAFKNFFGLFSIFLAFRCLDCSKSFKFELFWSNFAIKTIFAENLAKWISVKGDFRLYFELVEKSCRGRHHSEISKTNTKTLIYSIWIRPQGSRVCQKMRQGSLNTPFEVCPQIEE